MLASGTNHGKAGTACTGHRRFHRHPGHRSVGLVVTPVAKENRCQRRARIRSRWRSAEAAGTVVEPRVATSVSDSWVRSWRSLRQASCDMPFAPLQAPCWLAASAPAAAPARHPHQAAAQVEVKVPDIGDFLTSLSSKSWSAGDTVNFEQSLVTLESDKATMEVPSTAAGGGSGRQGQSSVTVSRPAELVGVAAEVVPAPVAAARPLPGSSGPRSPAASVAEPVAAASRCRRPPQPAPSTKPPQQSATLRRRCGKSRASLALTRRESTSRAEEPRLGRAGFVKA